MPGVTVHCIDCKHISKPSNDPSDDKMLRMGWATCELQAKEPGAWLSAVYPRECADFYPSPDSDKRREWLARSH